MNESFLLGMCMLHATFSRWQYFLWSSVSAFHSEGLISFALNSLKGSPPRDSLKNDDVWDQKQNHSLLCTSASSCFMHHKLNQPKYGKEAINHLCSLKSFIPTIHRKSPVLSTSIRNEPSIWQYRMFSLWSGLRRCIYLIWNAVFIYLFVCPSICNIVHFIHFADTFIRNDLQLMTKEKF